jgi:hypothetical protein
MGRAQGQVADLFTRVLGDRRGASSKRHLTFGQTKDAQERRMNFLSWWSKREGGATLQQGELLPEGMSMQDLLKHYNAYLDVDFDRSPNFGKPRYTKHTCQRDLISLVKQGILETSEVSSVSIYSFRPFSSWSQDHQRKYREFLASLTAV